MKWKPAFSIEQVVRRMKQFSIKFLWEKQEFYFKKHYWGHDRFGQEAIFVRQLVKFLKKKLKNILKIKVSDSYVSLKMSHLSRFVYINER